MEGSQKCIIKRRFVALMVWMNQIAGVTKNSGAKKMQPLLAGTTNPSNSSILQMHVNPTCA